MKRLKIILIHLCIFAASMNLSFSQSTKFAVADGINLTSGEGRENFGEVINSLNQISDLDFVLFTNISTELKFLDDDTKTILKKIKHPAYFLPSEENFWREYAAREKFYNTFGEYNFLRQLDSIKILGINSAVSWSPEPFFEREVFNFIDRRNPSRREPVILALNNSPVEIKNFDDIISHLDSTEIKFIVAPLISNKLIYDDEIILINSKNISRNKESFKIIEVKGDEVTAEVYNSTGKQLTSANRTIKGKPFSESKSMAGFNTAAAKVWTYDMGYTLAAEIITDGDRIYAADVSGQVVCLNSRGKKLWDYYSFGYIYSTPTVSDNYLAIATIQGDLETINASSGNPLQALGFDSPITADLTSFDFAGPVNLMIPKESNSKAAVIVGTQNGKVFCYDLETLQEHWRFEEANGEISGKPLVVKDHVFFYCLDGYIYSLSASTGLLTWKAKLADAGELPASTLVTDGHNVFITLSNGDLISFDILLGKKNWENNKYNLTTSLAVSSNGRLLYGKSKDDRFHILSAQTGSLVREVYTKVGKHETNSSIIERNGEIYFGDNSGYLIKIDDNYETNKFFRETLSPINTIKQIDKDKILIAHYNGLITLIKIGE